MEYLVLGLLLGFCVGTVTGGEYVLWLVRKANRRP